MTEFFARVLIIFIVSGVSGATFGYAYSGYKHNTLTVLRPRTAHAMASRFQTDVLLIFVLTISSWYVFTTLVDIEIIVFLSVSAVMFVVCSGLMFGYQYFVDKNDK